MPDDGQARPDRGWRHHQCRSNTVSVNQIRRFTLDRRARLNNREHERGEVTNQAIRAPGESGRQRVNRHRSNSEAVHFLAQWTISRTQHYRIKAFPVELFQNHQQDALGAADSSRMIVKKDLHVRVYLQD